MLFSGLVSPGHGPDSDILLRFMHLSALLHNLKKIDYDVTSPKKTLQRLSYCRC